MKHQPNADLHCHSVFSDGTLEPEALASRAKANGVTLWALTDHDEIGGLARASAAAAALGLDFVNGVEISVSFLAQTVHIVGLGFDANNQALRQGLAHNRSTRLERAQAMAEGLAKVGIEGAFEGALAHAGNTQLISRTHLARFLVERGICQNTGAVFRRYLKPGKPGYVPHSWVSLEQALGWVINAGGVAVIAHPGCYKFSANEQWALLSEFKKLGGSGIEVITGSHCSTQNQNYAQVALEFNLAASIGSDFHCPKESRTDLGSLPTLPKPLTPIWQLLASVII